MMGVAFDFRKGWVILFLLCFVWGHSVDFLHKGYQNASLLLLSTTLHSQDSSQYTELTILLRDAIRIAPSETMIRGLGLLLAAEGDEDAFDAVWLDGGFPTEDILYWGEFARQKQQYEVALAWYERGIRINPAWADPWYYKGLVLEKNLQREEALAAFEQAKIAKEYTQIGESDAYVHMGRLLDASGENLLAKVNFDIALEKDDFQYDWTKILALNGKANGLLREQEFDSAIELLEDAILLDPDYEWSYIRLGKAYLGCCGDQTLALQYLEKAIQINPKNKWAYLAAGDVYLQYGYLTKAHRMYEQSLKIDPDWEEALKRLDSRVLNRDKF